MLTRWIAHTIVRALPFTLALGLLLGALRAGSELRAGLWLPVFDELQRGLLLAAGLTLLFLLASLLFRGMARSLGLKDVPATALGTAAALAPIYSVAGYEVNRRLLPGITEPASIVGNLLMLGAMVYFWSFLGRWFTSFRANPPGAMPSALRYWPLLLIAAVPVCAGVLRAAAPPVPVLFVLIDTLRADRLGCYGNPASPSPSLDRLAREGILYQDVVTPATSTKSSIASLFTGKDVYAHGVYMGNREDREGYVTQRIREEEETMAEAFRDAGYMTVAWVQNGHVTKLSRYDQGFASFTENAGSVNTIYDRFMRWFPRGRRYPFFAYLHIIDVHGPYKPPAPWNKLYRPDAFSIYDRVPVEEWRKHVRMTRLGEFAFETHEMEKIRSLYDGQIKLVDSVLGKLFEQLRDAGLYDSTCIVVTSDHGDGFQEHGFMGHSHYPYA
ncbi:MAG: sulfatase-like hydrolase/transferase, partial [Gemmatimonadetes bacterium]|nr:sulfatase-like hydrolase/transferase [Gemmatimonadota bacterium]